jgi:hypothetical protein
MNNAVTIPFRWITPSQLAICIILFFLPWVEIQCPMPKGLDFNNPNAQFDPKNIDWTPMVRQSGFQAATGNYSFVDPNLQKMTEQANTKDKKDDKPAAALLLWVFFLAVIAGTSIGFIVPSSSKKKGLLLVCCIVAFGTVGTQAAIGFPISSQTKNEMKRDKGQNNMPMGMGLKEDEMFKTSLKISFYLTLLFCLGATVTTLLESVPKPRKKKRHTEEEDEASEDEPNQPADW